MKNHGSEPDVGQRSDTPRGGVGKRSVVLRTAILDAATDLFFAHGYDMVSVDAIIARVGGSKTTIYQHFAGKEGLLKALVERESVSLLRPLDEIDQTGRGLDEVLRAFGAGYLAVIYNERAVALHRLVIAQGRRFPGLVETFAAAGPAGARLVLSRIVRRWQQAGRLDIGRDPDLLAQQFLNLLKAGTHARLLLGLPDETTEDERREAIDAAVETFLRGASR